MNCFNKGKIWLDKASILIAQVINSCRCCNAVSIEGSPLVSSSDPKTSTDCWVVARIAELLIRQTQSSWLFILLLNKICNLSWTLYSRKRICTKVSKIMYINVFPVFNFIYLAVSKCKSMYVSVTQLIGIVSKIFIGQWSVKKESRTFSL